MTPFLWSLFYCRHRVFSLLLLYSVRERRDRNCKVMYLFWILSGIPYTNLKTLDSPPDFIGDSVLETPMYYLYLNLIWTSKHGKMFLRSLCLDQEFRSSGLPLRIEETLPWSLRTKFTEAWEGLYIGELSSFSTRANWSGDYDQSFSCPKIL